MPAVSTLYGRYYVYSPRAYTSFGLVRVTRRRLRREFFTSRIGKKRSFLLDGCKSRCLNPCTSLWGCVKNLVFFSRLGVCFFPTDDRASPELGVGMGYVVDRENTARSFPAIMARNARVVEVSCRRVANVWRVFRYQVITSYVRFRAGKLARQGF